MTLNHKKMFFKNKISKFIEKNLKNFISIFLILNLNSNLPKITTHIFYSHAETASIKIGHE